MCLREEGKENIKSAALENIRRGGVSDYMGSEEGRESRKQRERQTEKRRKGEGRLALHSEGLSAVTHSWKPVPAPAFLTCLFAHVEGFIVAVNLSVCCYSCVTNRRMGACGLSLALLFLLSSPIQAQWWSFIWANPKSGSSPANATSPSLTSPSPSGSPETTEWVGKEDRVTEKAVEGSTQTEASVLAFTPNPGASLSDYSTEEPGMLAPEEDSGPQSRSQYKPLKLWKSGECYRGNEKTRHF